MNRKFGHRLSPTSVAYAIGLCIALFTSQAWATCTKEDRSGCDLPQQVGPATVDQMEKVAPYLPCRGSAVREQSD